MTIKARAAADVRRAWQAFAVARGAPARCETNVVGSCGECIVCHAANGEACLRELCRG